MNKQHIYANIDVNFATAPTQPQYNSKVGFYMKMTLHHHRLPPPQETQHQEYLSYYQPDFNQTLDLAFWDQ